MKAKGPREERETIINFNEAEDKATIWTASESIYRKLIKRLGTESLIEDEERHAVFECAKAWVTLPRRRVARTLSSKQLKALSLSRAKGLKRAILAGIQSET